MTTTRSICSLAALLFAGLVTCRSGIADTDLGPLYSSATASDGSELVRAAGPLVEWQKATNGSRFFALHPFYASVFDSTNNRVLREFMWPLGMSKCFMNERFWRVVVAFGHDFDATHPESRYRFVLFPIVFAGVDVTGRNYFAVFPAGGRIREFLGCDVIDFALFPLFARSNVGETRTTDVLWPLISWTTGPRVWRYRFFPFYMRSYKENSFDKVSILWPFWSSARYFGKTPAGRGFILFPLVGHAKTEDQNSWMVFPPFIRWSYNKRGYRAVNCPWPFFQYSHDPEKKNPEKLFFWPIWGRKSFAGTRSQFFLWPIFWNERIDRGDRQVRRVAVTPFLYHETVRRGGVSNGVSTAVVVRRYFKLWPLFSYARDGEATALKMFDLWPGGPLQSVERNYSRLWTVFSRKAGPGTVDEELLWGLYRRTLRTDGCSRLSVFPLFSFGRDAAGGRTWSLFGGLVGHGGLHEGWQVLYFMKFGAKESQP